MDSNFSNVTKRSLTRKQKLLWGAGILIVFLYFNPSILRPVFGAFTGSAPHKPSPIANAPVGPTPEQVAAASAAASFAQQTTEFAGKWAGNALVKGRGTCRFGVEIGTQQNPDKPFTAYTNMLCVDMTLPPGGKMNAETAAILTAERLAPESTVLSGSVVNGTMTYKADRVVSHGQGKCDMQSMDITPFGSGQVAAEWKDNCGGGEMTLAKIN
jgi:hypothetical protein